MQVVVNGLLTSYKKQGSGKVIALLHGWGDSSSTFDSLSNQLSKKYTVVALDLPGFGGTQLPSGAWGLSDYVDFVDAWLNKIRVKKVYAFVGHSNGGAIAITGLGTSNLSAEKLVLLSSAGVRDRASARKLAMKSVAKTGKVLTAVLPKNSRNKLRNKFYKTINSDIVLMPQMEETFKKVVSEDVQQSASKISVPTLLVYGIDDRETPTSFAKKLNGCIKGSELVIIPSGGHFIHQNSQETLDVVAKFLND